MSLLDAAIEAVARARAPKESPRPAGPELGLHPLLERPACPGCGNTRAKSVVAGGDTWIPNSGPVARHFEVVRCEVCALRYTTPRYRREHRRLAFEGAYPFYVRARAARSGRDPIARAQAHAPFLNRAAHLCAVQPRPGRLLDVGCGDGYFLDLMRDRGWDGSGIDVEEDVVWHGRDQLGLIVERADVEHDALPEGPFDAISLWGVLQLLYEPRRALERLRSLLAPGGVLAIGVSNISGLGARLFDGRWRGLGLPRHLSHFTPGTLSTLVTRSGFQIERICYETPRWIVAGSVDDSLPARIRPFAKAALYATAQAAGRSRYADTIELYARA